MMYSELARRAGARRRRSRARAPGSTAARTVRAISGVNTIPITTMIVRVERRPARPTHEERRDDQRQREEGLDEAADDVVGEAAEVAHDQPERGAEHGAEQRRQRRDDQDVPRPDDHAREHVAAELVGAEPVGARRRLVDRRRGSGRTGPAARSRCRRSRTGSRSTRIIAPTMNVFWRTSWRRDLAARLGCAGLERRRRLDRDRRRRSFGTPPVPDPRIQQREHDVGDQRGEHVDDADHEHAGLEHREVLVVGRVVDQRSDPW